MREFIITLGYIRVVLDRVIDRREDRIGYKFREEKYNRYQGQNRLQELDFNTDGINIDREIKRELIEEEIKELEQEVER